ncbi:MAG: hypothetical protein H0X72_21595 [Acidobacteria bacterium]|jgi:hypothetical protein|nr:hypothetical protein [Acidobacteriota bacterium]
MLNLLKPISMVDFEADLHESANGGNGPVLYKEWRFKSRVQSGTGIFFFVSKVEINKLKFRVLR